MSQKMTIDPRDSATIAQICLGKQGNIEQQLAMLRDVQVPPPDMTTMLQSVLEAQSVILLALWSLHTQRSGSAPQHRASGLVIPNGVRVGQ